MSPCNKKLYTLSITDLRLWVHLGCSDQEKISPQPVSCTITLAFNTLPAGAITDQLEDTVCYLALVQQIKTLCQSKHFNLLEHLTAAGYNAIYALVSPHHNRIAHIKVTMRKIAPPIADLQGGVAFTYYQALSEPAASS